ncbi:hypothetical protein CCR75_004799 [Bremia lactucae]|uniref:BZIP domain-containing protein n=1 Tax=Bremia lactucae TaxID=4779 RepID=A0A976ID24_BRELC|nr:hypothetical protein CCR75_004799 [Bremia lactucae]
MLQLTAPTFSPRSVHRNHYKLRRSSLAHPTTIVFTACVMSRHRHVPHWTGGEDHDLAASDLVKSLRQNPSRNHAITDRMPLLPHIWGPPIETASSLGINDWHLVGSLESPESPAISMDYRDRTYKGESTGDIRGFPRNHVEFDQNGHHGLQELDETDVTRTRAYQMGYDVEARYSQAQLQRYQQQRQYTNRLLETESSYRRLPSPSHESEFYPPDMRDHEPLDNLTMDLSRRIPRNFPGVTSPSGSLDLLHSMRTPQARAVPTRHYTNPDEVPLEPGILEMYPDNLTSSLFMEGPMSRRREFVQSSPFVRHRGDESVIRRQPRATQDMMMTNRRLSYDSEVSYDRQSSETHATYDNLTPSSSHRASLVNYRHESLENTRHTIPQQVSGVVDRGQVLKRPRQEESLLLTSSLANYVPSRSTVSDDVQPKRRCGRKSMNYSSEQKRERNRAAVKKCRQRQALKWDYLHQKAEALAAENQTLSQMLVKNTRLPESQRTSVTRGIQMDILLKIKEIFTQSLPKDFVLDVDSIWDLNSVLAVSMPSRCYFGLESIKDFWRTSLRMRNKGKIRSFWAWLFRLSPGERFTEFDIQPFSPSSNLYYISWTTKSTPPLTGSIVIMFGAGHRVTLHIECFGWLIWRYLLTNEPFPEFSTEKGCIED